MYQDQSSGSGLGAVGSGSTHGTVQGEGWVSEDGSCSAGLCLDSVLLEPRSSDPPPRLAVTGAGPSQDREQCAGT